MKTIKMLFIVILGGMILFMPSNSTAQVPQGFSYQAVARDGAGLPIPNLASLPMKITILNDTTKVYVETHASSTNAFGLFTLTIGSGTASLGTFASINWASGTYSMKVEADFGSGYLNMGTQPLLTVPFAMVAKSVSPGVVWSQNGSDIYYDSGEVGIGTNSPQDKLHIYNAGYLRFNRSTHAQLQGIRFVKGSVPNDTTDWKIEHKADRSLLIDAPNGRNLLLAMEAGSRVGIGAVPGSYGKLYLGSETIWCGGIYLDQGGIDGAFLLQTANAPMRFGTNNIERMRIGSDGTVHIKGDGTYLSFEDANGQTGSIEKNASGLYFKQVAGAIGIESTSGYIRFVTNNTERMRIVNDGRVAIGTATPATGYQLSVDGKIICTEVRVELRPWPDYVFKSGYNLMPLDKVEETIKEKGHLPNIPPAHEIETHGMDVGVMQAKMMEKIEELTLYLIEANKKIEATNEKVERLEKENESLRNSIEKLK